MTRYPAEESSLSDLIKKSFRLHYLTLKHVVFFILLMTLLKYVTMISFLFVSNAVVKSIIYFFTVIVAVFLFSAALYSSHEAFMDRPKTFSDALVEIKNKVATIYSAFFGYVLAIAIAYFFAKLITYAVQKILPHGFSTVHGVSLIISATILLMSFFMFFYSYPLAVIDNKKIQHAFHDSMLLSDKNKLGLFFLAAILLAVNLLISPASLQEYFLSTYHLGVFYDFLVLCVMVPFFINLLLLLMNDARIQLIAEVG